MIKQNRLLLTLCLSVSSLALYAGDPASTLPRMSEIEEQVDADPQLLKSIKIEDAAMVEDAEKIETLKTASAKKRSLLSKCFLAMQSMGAGAVSLLCGACFLSNTAVGIQWITNNSPRQTFHDKFNKSLKGVACLGGAAAFIVVGYGAYEYGRDSLKALKGDA